MTGVLAFRPEKNIQEIWKWTTDTIVAVDGTEQRIAVYRAPKRSLTAMLTFDSTSAVNSALAFLYANLKIPMYVPWYQQETKLTVKGLSGTNSLSFDATRTDLRANGKCLVTDDVNSQLLTIVGITGSGITTVEPLAQDWSIRSRVMPAVLAYAANNATVTRERANNYAKVAVTVEELKSLSPFLSPLNTTALFTVGAFPVLSQRGTGQSFADSFDTGIDVQQYGGGAAFIRSPWLYTTQTFGRTFLAQSLFDSTVMPFWQAFGDYCAGNVNPFYAPTWRADFTLLAALAPGATSFTTQGRDYLDLWHADPAYRGIFFETAGGVHYAAVTAVAISGGDTVVTFSPALPGGAAYGDQRQIGFMVLSRIADDMIALQHYGSYTTVTVNMRAVHDVS